MASDRVQTFIRLRSTSGHWLVDPALRTRLVEEASEGRISLTELVARILARRYQVDHQPPQGTGFPTQVPAPDGDIIKVWLPRRTHRAVSASTIHPHTIADTCRAALSAHYGLKVPPKPGRRAA